ncbi:MAG: SRPBCC family protein, partial [bacterium]
MNPLTKKAMPQTVPNQTVPNLTLQAERRMLLINATMTAISIHGFSNLTLAKISALAGLTAGTVNFHFETKEALLLATLRSVAEEFEFTVDQATQGVGQDPVKQLTALIEASLSDEIIDFKKVAVWYAFFSEANSREDYHDICGNRERKYAQTVLSVCDEIISSAGKQRQLNAKAISRAICGLVDEIWQEILFEGEDFDLVQARCQCSAFLASVFPWCFEMPVEQVPASESDPLPNVEENLTYTLPAWIYSSENFFKLEKERIFMSSWQIVCHTSDIKRAGRYVTFQLFSERAFVVRTQSGSIKAFHNVCRHRAHMIVAGEQGVCPGKLVCPYHGWTYNLDGERIAVAFPSSFREHDAANFSLHPIDCEVYAGFVFIRFRSEGPGVVERMAPVNKEFEAYRTPEMIRDIGREDEHSFWTQDIDVDWKNGVENFLEDYHFFMGRKGLSALMADEYDRQPFDTEISRLSHAMRETPKPNWSVEKYHRLLLEQTHLPAHMRRRWTYYVLYPNTFIDIYPEKMDFFQILPIGPGKSQLRGRSYALHKSATDRSREMKAVRYLNNRINAQVQHEDNVLTASVQEGLASSSYSVGVLLDKEVLVKQFGDFVRSRIPVASLLFPPGESNGL